MGYVDSKDPAEIASIEDRIFQDYKRVIEEYAERFKAYGCDIVILGVWDYGDGKLCHERPPLKKGYAFGISFDIVDENGVMVMSDDHDVNMTAGWTILSYGDKHCLREDRSRVVYDEMDLHEDEVREALDDFLGYMEFCGRHRLD